MTSYSKTLKICRKAKSYMWVILNEWKWLTRWKTQMPGQYHETVQKEKKTKEVLGLSFFLWKLEAERAKGDELEIEQVAKKLSEGIRRSAGRLFHRAGAWW